MEKKLLCCRVRELFLGTNIETKCNVVHGADKRKTKFQCEAIHALRVRT